MANYRLLLVFLCVFILIPFKNPGTEITFIDVGQGDGIYLSCGEDILIDAGSSSTKHIGEYTIEPFLLSKGITELDKVFITHADSDHTSGILYLSENGKIRIQQLYLPYSARDDEKYDKLRNICGDVGYLRAGDEIDSGVGSISVLGPVEGNAGNTSDTNEQSLILLYTESRFSALFMGDAPISSEQDMLDYVSSQGTALLNDISVLKAGHHGSSTSTSPELLEATRPRLAILSYGEGNRYGHPHRETLNLLSEYRIPHLDTACSGAITVQTDGHSMEISEFLSR